jgi:hypothetical protein
MRPRAAANKWLSRVREGSTSERRSERVFPSLHFLLWMSHWIFSPPAISIFECHCQKVERKIL